MFTAYTRPAKQLVLPLAIILIIWMVFLPRQLGGSVSYIIINGKSMEPEIHFGDLVVARKSTLYQLNQRVIYEHPDLGFVFHRIVDQEDGKFVLQGDNNDWLDTYRPTQNEILGRFWYVIPGAGKIVQAIRQPLLFTVFVLIISSLIIGFVVLPDQVPITKRKGKQKRMSKDHRPPPTDDIRLEILVILLGIAAVALVFGLFALSKDPKMTITDDLIYTQEGSLTYSAKGPANVYDSADVQTGDPVYPALTCLIDLYFDYSLGSPRLNGVGSESFQGTVQFEAEVRDNDGWHRTIILAPETDFPGRKVQASSTLDICEILDMTDVKEIKTGVGVSTYSLAILPVVEIDGEVAGLDVEEEFTPEFTFDLNESVLRVPYQSEGLHLEQEGLIPHSFTTQNLMGIFGKQFPVIGVRWAAFGILAACLMGAFFPARSLYREWTKSERSRIEFQHRSVLIDLKDSQIQKKKYTVIDLEGMGDLRKLADRYGAMIMHEVEGKIHRYLVVDEGFIYQFVSDESLDPNSSDEAGKE